MLASPDILKIAVLAAAAFVLVAAAWRDIKTLLIPNTFVLALLALFPLFWSQVLGFEKGLWHLAVGGGVLVVGMILFALRWAGGGDVKLLAVVGLWAGPDLILPCLLAMGLAGGILSLVYGVREIRRRRLVKREVGAAVTLQHTAIPYGVAIAAAGLWVLYSFAASEIALLAGGLS